MITFKCKMCGGDLHPEENATTCECEYCGSVQTIPTADNEKKGNLFNRANRLRMAAEYDKAAAVYTSITAEFPEEAEAYWGLCLCKYGIEYVEDPLTAKKIPTCHRTRSESILDDPDFDQACENADAVAKRVYREEAKAIDRLQQDILSVVANESPYDVFICYKETDDDGQRTEDSVLAQDIYDSLTAKGLKVFFARITLEDKLGQQYEPFIYAALHSAKVMLAIGTQFEYFDAVWVKNEWSRFLDMMKIDKSKTLIPCYKDIDAYDMPREFKNLQAQDMNKLGWLQDLARGVLKLCGKDVNVSREKIIVQQVVQPAGPTVESLLKRGFMFLEDADWDNATAYADKALDVDTENGQAYMIRLLAGLKLKNMEQLKTLGQVFESSPDYIKAVRFADDVLRTELDVCKRENDHMMAELAAQAQAKADKEAAERAERIKHLTEVRRRVNECNKLFDISNSTILYLLPDYTMGYGRIDENGEQYFSDGPYKDYKEAGNWKNCRAIVQSDTFSLSEGKNLACLLENGTVTVESIKPDREGSDDPKKAATVKRIKWDTRSWKNIVSIQKKRKALIGLREDGTIAVTGDDEYKGMEQLCDVAEVFPRGDIARYCRFIKRDGSVWQFNKGKGEELICPAEEQMISSGYIDGYLFADGRIAYKKDNESGEWQYYEYSDVVYIVGESCSYAIMKEDGTVTGRFAMGENKNTKQNSFYDFTWEHIVGLKSSFRSIWGISADGRIHYAVVQGGKFNTGVVSGVRLFNDFDHLADERCQALKAREQKHKQQLEALKKQLSATEAELSNLKGLFAGKRRKELEAAISELKAQIMNQEQMDRD